MHPDARALAWDALSAAERIDKFAAGTPFDDYVADDMLKSAVERQFEIIGESLNRLPC
jgi:uncharacterized protein with HEPN domain